MTVLTVLTALTARPSGRSTDGPHRTSDRIGNGDVPAAMARNVDLLFGRNRHTARLHSMPSYWLPLDKG